MYKSTKNRLRFKFSKPSVCLYTAIFGRRENAIDSGWLKFGVPVICFSDRKDIVCPGVTLIYSPAFHEDPTRAAKLFKILPHLFLPQYSSSIWFDANMHAKDFDLDQLLSETLRQADLALFSHPERNCVYEEANVCLSQRRDHPETIIRQISDYRRRNYPENNKLYASGFLVRKHLKDSMIELSQSWWKEICSYSRRDQISMPVALHENKINVHIIVGSIWDNQLFSVAPHAGPELQLSN